MSVLKQARNLVEAAHLGGDLLAHLLLGRGHLTVEVKVAGTGGLLGVVTGSQFLLAGIGQSGRLQAESVFDPQFEFVHFADSLGFW